MYNPLPHLPSGFQRFIRALKSNKIHPKIILITLGLLSTFWFLIRVIPKPTRAAYPCMQATAPFMSGFVIYLLSLTGTVMAAKSFKKNLIRSRYRTALVFMFISASLFLFTQSQIQTYSSANTIMSGQEYFTPNAPIGEARGIFPGRVVWMWDPDATNENCTNTSNNNGIIDAGDDGWFMDFNNNQPVIDSMVSKSLLALTGASGDPEAWDKIFRYYNNQHDLGDIGYTAGQKIFIKINATSAYGGVSGNHYYSDLSRNDDLSKNAFASETDPYVVLSLLRQLVENAGIPQEMIYIGDPARNIYKEIFEIWHSEFPSVKYLGNNLIHPELDVESLGRLPVEATAEDKVFFSDDGAVMPDAVSDKLFTIFEDMDYLINLPTMKAHNTAGITLAAKNHFGSFTRTWAMHMHPGLMGTGDDPFRQGYELYRVQTDIMMHKLLSGKNLLIIADGLYPGEDALGVPFKWESAPFNNDWCSSIFMSLDPVALESVCHDFLRAEYNGPTIAESRPNWYGVDDYLHQAADSSLWPQDVIYDPDNDGILYASLGVHEHWNDPFNKQYTRNLASGEGIELIKANEWSSGVDYETKEKSISIFPNPASEFIIISNPAGKKLLYNISNLQGQVIKTGKINGTSLKEISLADFSRGVYFLRFAEPNNQEIFKFIKLQ